MSKQEDERRARDAAERRRLKDEASNSKRARALLLLRDGCEPPQVAQRLGVTPCAVRRWAAAQ